MKILLVPCLVLFLVGLNDKLYKTHKEPSRKPAVIETKSLSDYVETKLILIANHK